MTAMETLREDSKIRPLVTVCVILPISLWPAAGSLLIRG